VRRTTTFHQIPDFGFFAATLMMLMIYAAADAAYSPLLPFFAPLFRLRGRCRSTLFLRVAACRAIVCCRCCAAPPYAICHMLLLPLVDYFAFSGVSAIF